MNAKCYFFLRCITVVTILNSGIGIIAQPKFQWAQNSREGNNDEARSIAVDQHGNTYVAGSYYYSMNFGTTNFTLGCCNWDAFLAKYDPQGQLLWARPAGGNNHD